MFLRGAGVLLASLQGLLSVKGQVWDTTLSLPGCEGLAADGSYLWVFSYDRRAAIQDTAITGHLYRLRASEETPFIREMTPEGRWHPFGLAYQAPYLWFLHGPKDHPTEVWRFTWDREKLSEPRVWQDRRFVSLQAICPVGPERFFVANDRSHRARWHLVAGFFVRRVRSTVFLCAGDSCRSVADRIPYASGLAYSASQQRLLVSVAFRKALWVYEETEAAPNLRYVRRIRLPGYPDNITALNDTLFWVVCHRRLTAWARSLAFGGKRSRWLIVAVRAQPDGNFHLQTLYSAPKGYATASIALPIGPYVYVGSLFEPYLLRFKAAEAIPPHALPPNTSAAPAPTPPAAR